MSSSIISPDLYLDGVMGSAGAYQSTLGARAGNTYHSLSLSLLLRMIDPNMHVFGRRVEIRVLEKIQGENMQLQNIRTHRNILVLLAEVTVLPIPYLCYACIFNGTVATIVKYS